MIICWGVAHILRNKGIPPHLVQKAVEWEGVIYWDNLLANSYMERGPYLRYEFETGEIYGIPKLRPFHEGRLRRLLAVEVGFIERAHVREMTPIATHLANMQAAPRVYRRNAQNITI